MNKICAVTGHRPKSFPWNYRDKNCIQRRVYLKNLESTVRGLIEHDGFDYFISGGAIGVDQDFAEIVINFKKRYPHIRLEIAVPCPNQNINWCDVDKKRYARILRHADFVNTVSPIYMPQCMQVRNEYMADKCDLMIVVWNGQEYGGTYNTFTYFKILNKPYKLIALSDQNQ